MAKEKKSQVARNVNKKYEIKLREFLNFSFIVIFTQKDF